MADMPPTSELLRSIPPVHEVMQYVLQADWSARFHPSQLISAVREELDDLRSRLLAGESAVPDTESVVEQVRVRIGRMHAYSLQRVINATGIIVHTNLGRAPLAQAAIDHLSEVAGGYSNLEFDLERGARGSRETHLEEFMSRLLSCEASLVVNNNASALMLLLNTFAEGKEVLVSRGELVEIGGSFRLPDIMRKSQAILREVGTTNKTRLEDYRNAISEETGLILVVHPSNYQIIGFTEKPDAAELVALGARHQIPVMEDHGSGILEDLTQHGIPDEPRVADRLHLGFDAVCFSGDKILGGPQAGVVCGKKDRIRQMRGNPLFRALRVDKMVYAALEATLRLYLTGRAGEIPVVRMLSMQEDQMHRRAEEWRTRLAAELPEATVDLEQTVCYVGGGVAPMKGIDSWAVSLVHPRMPAHDLAAALRRSDPPVVARIEDDRLLFELRTLTPGDQEAVAGVLRALFQAT